MMEKSHRHALYMVLLALCLMLFTGVYYQEEAPALSQRQLLGSMEGYSVYAGAAGLGQEGEYVQFSRDALLRGLMLRVSPETPIPQDMPAQQARNVRKMIGLYVPVTEDVSLSEETIYALCSLCEENALLRTWIISGMRSPAEQNAMQSEAFEQYRSTMTVAQALKNAERNVPSSGMSEHQLSTAFDVQFQGTLDWSYEDPLDRSADGRWLKENAWRFGFIRRYPPEKQEATGIANEELHFRYVGKTHAAIMQATGWCLEEYLEALHLYGAFTLETPAGEAYVLCSEMTENGAAFWIPEGYTAAPSADNMGYAVCMLTKKD